jgi:hypothetical protein
VAPDLERHPALNERIAGLTAVRDQAQADAERAQAMAESAGQQTITPQMVRKVRQDSTGAHADRGRRLSPRASSRTGPAGQVADGKVRIMGSKGDLLRTLAAGSGENRLRPAFAVLF